VTTNQVVLTDRLMLGCVNLAHMSAFLKRLRQELNIERRVIAFHLAELEKVDLV
jgi:hypothetical protein